MHRVEDCGNVQETVYFLESWESMLEFLGVFPVGISLQPPFGFSDVSMLLFTYLKDNFDRVFKSFLGFAFLDITRVGRDGNQIIGPTLDIVTTKFVDANCVFRDIFVFTNGGQKTKPSTKFNQNEITFQQGRRIVVVVIVVVVVVVVQIDFNHLVDVSYVLVAHILLCFNFH
jgi:hypothetical protein